MAGNEATRSLRAKLRSMKPGVYTVSGAVVVLATFLACSSTPVQPPIDTSGSNAAGQGGGGSAGGSGSSDGGTGVAGADDASDALNTCLSGGCLGCCTTGNVCLAGNLNTACGISGGPCTVCPSPETCISNFCQ